MVYVSSAAVVAANASGLEWAEAVSVVLRDDEVAAVVVVVVFKASLAAGVVEVIMERKINEVTLGIHCAPPTMPWRRAHSAMVS